MLRGLAVFGHVHDHAEIIFDNVRPARTEPPARAPTVMIRGLTLCGSLQVRVPVDNMLLGEGRGFEIAQGRLGPGRIHHCMRTMGVAEMALAATLYRVYRREAFGKMLYEQDDIRRQIAEARLE